MKKYLYLSILFVLVSFTSSFAADSAVRAYPASTQSISATTWTTVNFGTENWDTDTEFSSPTFTAKHAGKHLVNTRLYVQGMNSGKRLSSAILKNGTIVAQCDNFSTNSTNDYEISCTDVVSLAVSDTVTIQVYHNDTGSRTVYNDSTLSYVAIQRQTPVSDIPTTIAWGSVTGTPTSLSGYGITDGVSTSRTLTINGTAYDLSVNRSWTISGGGAVAWGDITGDILDQTDLQAQFAVVGGGSSFDGVVTFGDDTIQNFYWFFLVFIFLSCVGFLINFWRKK